MQNSSNLDSFFYLTLFEDFGALRYLFFTLCLLLYVFINCANVVIILTVFLEKFLHQPMYVFICCLSLNSLYGSAGFFPRLLMDILSDTHAIARSSCFVQVFVLYMYAICEMTILCIMAYDRYVAICQPLHYRSRMTFRMVIRLVLWAELYPAFICSCCLSLTVRLPLCGNSIRRLFCTNWPVVQLSCVDTTVNNVAGLVATVVAIFLPLAFVLYTYLRIFLVARRSLSEFRGKALQTCLPHLVSFVNYSLSFVGELLLNRVKEDEINPYVVVFLSLEFLIMPPILNPLVYGLKLPQIRTAVVRYLKMVKRF